MAGPASGAVLTFSYRQVIAAFPDGGGACGEARTHLGRRAGLVAGHPW
ncbi:hypothetical protein GCM10009733_096260 [Nonomuraea maheshkhaliensis]|uniref:Uncharacterized protein n=1 Tax=Nonomuraea maheshkhaliensis TaxID=419590 RepID=A0ABP4T990_9ACTN